MKIESILSSGAATLHHSNISEARRTAETLLMHVLGCDRAYIHAHPERALTPEQQTKFEQVVARRAAGKPLQYITGHQEFWGLDLKVTPAVLIPRPETEHLVETALEIIRKQGRQEFRIVDVGTGSGCIILALASELKKQALPATLHAIDISAEALAVAVENAKALHLADEVEFHQGDLLAPLAAQRRMFDLVLSNPPYVGRSEWEKVQREVREYEPKVAVFSGERGLDIYNRLVPQARDSLNPGGWLLMEIGFSMEQQVMDLLGDWEQVRGIPDLQGIPRVIAAKRP